MQNLQGHSHLDRWAPLDDGAGVSLLRPAPTPKPIRFAAEPKPVEADIARSALIIIDMQNDFISAEGWFSTSRNVDVSCLSDVVGQINALSAAFRKVRAPVIHVNWAVRQDAANLPANVLDKGSDCRARPGYCDQIASGRVLVEGEWGAQSFADIDVDSRDMVVGKTRLTGFRDNELDSILRRLGVTTLFFAGVNLDRCVFATLADGCFNGFDAVLVEDATTTVSSPPTTEVILYLIRLLYGFTATSDDILAALSTQK